MFKIQTQTVILLCEQVFTIFLCIGEYVLIEIIPIRLQDANLLKSRGPLFHSRFNPMNVKVHYMYE